MIDKKAFNKIVGNKIKTSRKQAGKSQSKMAARIGVNRTTFINIEQGRQNISIYHLFLIAQALPNVLGVENLLPNEEQVKVEESTPKLDAIIKELKN